MAEVEERHQELTRVQPEELAKEDYPQQNGFEHLDEDEEEEEEDEKKEEKPINPERLKAFNMFVRLFIDENLDRLVPISKQPKEKINAIIQSCQRQFPEFGDRARKRIRTYLKSCRRSIRLREPTAKPSIHHIPASQLPEVNNILATACQKESEEAARHTIDETIKETPVAASFKKGIPLTHSEVISIKALIDGYRQSASFLSRSADDLERLLRRSQCEAEESKCPHGELLIPPAIDLKRKNDKQSKTSPAKVQRIAEKSPEKTNGLEIKEPTNNSVSKQEVGNEKVAETPLSTPDEKPANQPTIAQSTETTQMNVSLITQPITQHNMQQTTAPSEQSPVLNLHTKKQVPTSSLQTESNCTFDHQKVASTPSVNSNIDFNEISAKSSKPNTIGYGKAGFNPDKTNGKENCVDNDLVSPFKNVENRQLENPLKQLQQQPDMQHLQFQNEMSKTVDLNKTVNSKPERQENVVTPPESQSPERPPDEIKNKPIKLENVENNNVFCNFNKRPENLAVQKRSDDGAQAQHRQEDITMHVNKQRSDSLTRSSPDIYYQRFLQQQQQRQNEQQRQDEQIRQNEQQRQNDQQRQNEQLRQPEQPRQTEQQRQNNVVNEDMSQRIVNQMPSQQAVNVHRQQASKPMEQQQEGIYRRASQSNYYQVPSPKHPLPSPSLFGKAQQMSPKSNQHSSVSRTNSYDNLRSFAYSPRQPALQQPCYMPQSRGNMNNFNVFNFESQFYEGRQQQQAQQQQAGFHPAHNYHMSPITSPLMQDLSRQTHIPHEMSRQHFHEALHAPQSGEYPSPHNIPFEIHQMHK